LPLAFCLLFPRSLLPKIYTKNQNLYEYAQSP
jgi:hypothetical protein